MLYLYAFWEEVLKKLFFVLKKKLKSLNISKSNFWTLKIAYVFYFLFTLVVKEEKNRNLRQII